MGGGNWRDNPNHGLGLDELEDGRAFADELSRVDNTEPLHANLIHSLSKHFTGVTPFAGHMRGRERASSGGASMKDGSGSVAGEEESDGPKKKAKALGKKLIGRGS